MRRCFLAAGALTCLVAGPVQAANLLTNGDFSAGNSGFGSDYAFESFISSEGQYTVTAANTINNVNSFHDWTGSTPTRRAAQATFWSPTARRTLEPRCGSKRSRSLRTPITRSASSGSTSTRTA
jgi:hypothetical protein